MTRSLPSLAGLLVLCACAGRPGERPAAPPPTPAPELPAWPGEWTSAIDQPPGLTTYRVKQMLEGARRAHGAGALPAVFSASLSLKQEE